MLLLKLCSCCLLRTKSGLNRHQNGAMLPGLRAALPGLCSSLLRRYSHPGLTSSLLPGSSPYVRRLRSSGTRPHRFSCTVEPGLTEQFVFAECVDPNQDQDQEKDLDALLQTSCDLNVTREHRKRRGLEQQLQTLKTLNKDQNLDENLDLIQFYDSPPSRNLNPVRTKPVKTKPDRTRPDRIKADPDLDPDSLVSSVPCSGCGALLQAFDPVVPGFLPLHHLQMLPDQTEPKPESESQSESKSSSERTLCQRCHLLMYQRQLLEVQLDQDHFRNIISSRLRSSRALVLFVVDLVDLPSSIIPDLQDLIGTNKQVAVVGTKLDLLPVLNQSDLSSVKRRLQDYIRTLTHLEPVYVGLISAKTGFGIEELVSGLHRVWRHKGDVVMVGSTNAGKSTLFNALLESDYNRLSGSKKATESPWPGTTLNLLKFPILNPTPARLQRRLLRLKEEAQVLQSNTQSSTESAVPERDSRRLESGRTGYVSGHVGRTFKTSSRPVEIQFDPDLLAFGETEDGLMTRPVAESVQEELPPHEAKDAHWFYDTPGIIKHQDMLSLLTEQEVRVLVPVQALVPRTYVLKPGSTLFVGGLVRIDYISGPHSVWFSVLVSGLVPVHLSTVERADDVYEKHAGGRLLGVPMGGAERMKTFPKLSPEDVQVKGRSLSEAAADINISSTGWVAVTPPSGDVIQLRVWSPEEGGVTVRSPSLLPGVVMLKGARIRKSAAYKTHKPPAKPLFLSGQSTARKTKK